uniref:Uncharacterized protein n=1 Tax=Nicotiana tabacum TaxID=4097 RepID=A0A1S3ZZP6_TOBAC|nr:PREDICTED: uncharacterized protein LOC107792109 [Nicotiana tabacum]
MEQNEKLNNNPTREEIKHVVFGLNGDSAGGPDGFTGLFYQSCWEIIGEDIVQMEIVTDMRLRTRAGPNVVIKLDMTKAYDRFSWLFLTKVLRKVGFSERFIGLVFDLIGNNWYSVLINGQPHGFFKSLGGVKQGDLLSPTRFILAAEALSRGLNSLHTNLYFYGFGMPKWSPKINHLAYADDTIIFSSSDATSLRLIMEILQVYENASGQRFNKGKSAVYIHHLVDQEVVRKVERTTGIGRQDFPFTYLGCPIFYARRKMEHYQGLLTKVLDKLQTWKDFAIDDNIHNVSDVGEDETKGNFTVKSAWDYLRRREDPRRAYCLIWIKGMPFKIAFFMWKIWRAKLPLDDFMRKLGYSMASKCWFCAEPNEETLTHLFYTANAVRTVWKYFLNMAGIATEGLSLHQAITKCWTAAVLPRIKPILQALPSCICWELWKRRNILKHGEVVSVSRVIYQVSNTLQSLIKLRKLGLHVPHKWQDMLLVLENYTPKLKFEKVPWEFPLEGWIKANTDGASRGNPGRSSIGVCLRDEYGDVQYTVGWEINEGSNNEVEAEAMVEPLRISRSLNYSNIWLQTDSLLMKNIIDGIWKPPWNIVEQVEEIRRLKERCNLRISHIFREGNKLSDHLANYALDFGPIEAYPFRDLDNQSRKIVNEDKSQCPYIRVKVSRS